MQGFSPGATSPATKAGSDWTWGQKGPTIGFVGSRANKTGKRLAAGPRRPQGTGSLLLRTDRLGRETWYGKWRAGRVQRMQKLGSRREPGDTVGLTRREAEAE